ncbi:hypothetical protein ONZ45_g16864 [Pleurotus djamor]|nr:hypothetical protein ONZ45_g16864 [Pleurotus djamor]
MALFDFHIPNNQGVEVFAKALERKEKFRVWLYRHPYLELAWVIILGVVAFILSLFRIPSSSPKSAGLANSRTVTIPLDGFCLHKYRIHGLPYVMRNWNSEPSSVFYELAGPAFYKHTKKANLPLGARPYRPVTHPRLSSPFTSFVEEVLRLDDRELQFSLLTVIWFEKLVTWKMDTFGRAIYLQRVALPLLVNVALQLALSILTADGSQSTAALVLAGIQLGVIAFLAFQKLRQMRGTWLFFRSIYNYFDIGAVALSTTMAVMVLARRTPPRAFIAYSIPILWVDMILSSRVFEQSGTLMILLTEMTRGVLPFLCLLATFIVGFTFVPFFLLQAESPPDVSNPFTDYGRALGEMITFMSNDFNSLDPWKDELVTIRILRAIFTVVVSILLLNCLIALLNLKVEAADLKSRNIWIRQMAMLLVEIERGLLTDSERRRPHWFPRWFTYILTESERRRWQDFVDRNPLDLGYGPDDDDKGKGPGIQPTTVAPAPGPSGPSQPPHSDANKSAAPTPHTSTIVPSPDANPSDKPDVPTTVPISPPTQGGSAAQSHSPHVASPSTTVENIPLVPLKSSVSQSASEEASSSSDPLSVDKCQICNLGTTLVCSNCKSARYCSAEHQLVHWKEHKKVCKGKGKVTDTA